MTLLSANEQMIPNVTLVCQEVSNKVTTLEVEGNHYFKDFGNISLTGKSKQKSISSFCNHKQCYSMGEEVMSLNL